MSEGHFGEFLYIIILFIHLVLGKFNIMILRFKKCIIIYIFCNRKKSNIVILGFLQIV